jgi:energy-coupling factor transporter ATP-binding protein EcfA2
MADPRGSIWRRWDPHLHAPGTTLNDQFGGDFEGFLAAVEAATPPIVALGVTDYLSSRGYEAVLAAKRDGRLPGVELVFPNIELRLSIGTKAQRGVNFHVLVSPEDPEHLREIRRFLGKLSFIYRNERYACKRDELIALGRAVRQELQDDEAAYREGVNQFKVDFNELRRVITESQWVRENTLLGVAGSSSDGTAGMQDDTSSFAAQRIEIEAFCHIIFASSEKQVQYWLGNGTLDAGTIIARYRSLKACLHGSDAHSVGTVANPAGNRFTWIKGDPTFDGLRQACIEPAGRVHIGTAAPDGDASGRSCVTVKSHGAPWFADASVQLNPGLVAIIGSRGSGKTALADLIARAAGSGVPLEDNRSFVRRASALLAGVDATVKWSSGEVMRHAMLGPQTGDVDAVHYLSQQFVERLCSSEGPNDELIREIEKVVFDSHSAAERYGATTFEELLVARTGLAHTRRAFLRERLDRIASDALRQRELIAEGPAKAAKDAELRRLNEADASARRRLIDSGEQTRAVYYGRLKSAVDRRNRVLQEIKGRAALLRSLAHEAETFENEVFIEMATRLRARYLEAVKASETWRALTPTFAGDWRQALDIEEQAAAAELKAATEGRRLGAPNAEATADELEELSVAELEKALQELGRQIGLDKANARKLAALNQRIVGRAQQIERLGKDRVECAQAETRLRELLAERAGVYRSFFETVVDEEEALRTLYAPLDAVLRAASDSVRRLNLVVVRRVNLGGWAEKGEMLLDLRKAGPFRGHGSLEQSARELLLGAWQSGTAAEVSAAMARFRERYDEAIRAQAPVERRNADEYRAWALNVGRWLYSVDHINVTYSFEYDGVGLSQLSPGTRGVVLLLLYLALDVDDDRPLIIDQPEENLDPRTIFADLVGLFGEARKRRQVIMVTHNANLVVNTDVDQVIVATSARTAGEGAPRFVYRSGGLEDPGIRADVCEILEGGRDAFLERAKRLRVAEARQGDR